MTSEMTPAVVKAVPMPQTPKVAEKEPKIDVPAPPKPPQVETKPLVRPIEETLQAVAAQIESYLLSVGRHLEFRVDSASGRTVIAVRDAATGEVIRQIPSEEALRLAAEPGSPVLLNTVA